MAGAIIAAIKYVQYMTNPPRFAPVTWDSVTPADIQSVTICPLLSHNSIQGLTVDRSMPITDRKTVISMWQEMRGKNDRSGHWTFIEGLKVTYQLDSGKIIVTSWSGQVIILKFQGYYSRNTHFQHQYRCFWGLNGGYRRLQALEVEMPPHF